MQMHRETQGLHTIYRLKEDELGEVLGEAVISENVNEIRLHGIFVEPMYRGKGYAKTLMETVLGLGENKPITLCTGLGNVAFFRQFGFEIVDYGESLVSMERKP